MIRIERPWVVFLIGSGVCFWIQFAFTLASWTYVKLVTP